MSDDDPYSPPETAFPERRQIHRFPMEVRFRSTLDLGMECGDIRRLVFDWAKAQGYFLKDESDQEGSTQRLAFTRLTSLGSLATFGLWKRPATAVIVLREGTPTRATLEIRTERSFGAGIISKDVDRLEALLLTG